MLYRTGIVFLIAASMACSRGNDRPVAASPTGPTAANAEGSIVFVGGVSGPMDVLFPGRNDSFQFRNDLEVKYRDGLRRAAAPTAVDREGEVVWTQEYIRYRVNGCDHATALQRVMTQIDGGAAGGICSAPPDGEVLFPSRADSFEFRRALETKYQQMGRSNTSSVDAEGAVIWTQEYLRYRTNGCDHATAEAKVFSQIDGGPVPEVCLQPCALTTSPSGIDIGSGAMSGTFQVRPSRGGCAPGWTATSNASWLTFPGGTSPGAGFADFPFSVSQNNGSPRTGRITIAFSGGTTEFRVNQDGSQFNVGFTMTDPFRSGSQATTECHFRSGATPCNFSSFANLPGSTYTYAWTVSYVYPTTKSTSGTASTFSITDACGNVGSAADGPSVELVVTLTVTDNLGNSITVRSGEGNQPALVARLFTC
jgi:hypothetical protein